MTAATTYAATPCPGCGGMKSHPIASSPLLAASDFVKCESDICGLACTISHWTSLVFPQADYHCKDCNVTLPFRLRNSPSGHALTCLYRVNVLEKK